MLSNKGEGDAENSDQYGDWGRILPYLTVRTACKNAFGPNTAGGGWGGKGRERYDRGISIFSKINNELRSSQMEYSKQICILIQR